MQTATMIDVRPVGLSNERLASYLACHFARHFEVNGRLYAFDLHGAAGGWVDVTGWTWAQLRAGLGY